VNDEITIGHGGSAGDLVWHIPAMIDIARRLGVCKFTLLLKVNMPASYSQPHPCGNVLLNRAFAESLIPLLKLQPYLSDCRIWAGEDLTVDLDLFRCVPFDFRMGQISHFPCPAFVCTPDLSRPWLSVGEAARSGKVLLNRTTRYRNPALDYRRLKDCWFVGLAGENELRLPEVPTPTVLDLAREIEACRLFVGNQSLGMALASALDVERVMEVCPWCPNVPASSERCTTVWNQRQLDEVMASAGLLQPNR